MPPRPLATNSISHRRRAWVSLTVRPANGVEQDDLASYTPLKTFTQELE